MILVMVMIFFCSMPTANVVGGGGVRFDGAGQLLGRNQFGLNVLVLQLSQFVSMLGHLSDVRMNETQTCRQTRTNRVEHDQGPLVRLDQILHIGTYHKGLVGYQSFFILM